ncbi:MAG: response regulator [Vicinamibacterales bacterium]
MDDSFLTTEEVLAYLQVNLRTVYRLIKAGKIPAVRVGRQWRFRRRDIDAWLEQQSRPRGALGAGRQNRLANLPLDKASFEPAARRVLVADDEQSIRELLVQALALAEYDVEVASDGRAALERLRLGSCDLLITDLKMPGLDGLSLVREVRRLAPEMPIVIITGYSTEEAAIEALNLGVTGYLRKPFRVSKILAAAAKALRE